MIEFTPSERPQFRSVPVIVSGYAEQRRVELIRRLDAIVAANIDRYKAAVFPVRKPAAPKWDAVRKIILEVAVKHKVLEHELTSGARSKKIAIARHEACFRLRYERRLSMPVIGRILKRDHTTVLFGIRAHADRMGETSPEIEMLRLKRERCRQAAARVHRRRAPIRSM